MKDPVKWAKNAVKTVGWIPALSIANQNRVGLSSEQRFPYWDRAYGYIRNRLPGHLQQMLGDVKPGQRIELESQAK